jgi:hypothetical protein
MATATGTWPNACSAIPMWKKFKRLFIIKNKFEAYAIIYALSLGAVERGNVYMAQYPGLGGKLLFVATTGAVFMAGGKILDALRAGV